MYFLVSQVMSLKQCQHNDHVLANIKKICCVLFFKVKTWIFYVHVIYMNLCCFYFIHCTCLVTSQMFVPAAHSCMLHRFKSLEGGVVYIKWRFWKQITLTFFSGQWSRLGHCFYLFRKLAGLIYISVVIIDHIISLNLFSY